MMLLFLTVHGTGDKDLYTAQGKKAWWNSESLFVHIIKHNLALVGIRESRDYVWQSFTWDGRNSETSRSKAGERLAREIKYHVNDLRQSTISSDTDDWGEVRILIVAHSHGGNVAIHALTHLSNDRNLDKIKLFLVGTPIIHFTSAKIRELISRFMSKNYQFLVLFLLISSLSIKFLSVFFPNFATPALLFTLCGTFASGIYYVLLEKLRADQRNRTMLNLTKAVEAINPNAYQVATENQKTSANWNATQDNSKRNGKTFDQDQLKRPFAPSLEGSDKPLKKDPEKVIRVSDNNSLNVLKQQQSRKLLHVIGQSVIFFSRLDEAILALSRVINMPTIEIAEPSFVKNMASISILVITLSAFGSTVFLLAAFSSLNIINETYFQQGNFYWGVFVLISIAIFGSIWALYYAFAIALSPLINSVIKNILRARALGDDDLFRPITKITSHLPVRYNFRWHPMPSEFDELIEKHTQGAFTNVWKQMKEFLVVAQFMENRQMFNTLENSGVVNWDTLVHTSYFTEKNTVNFLAFALLNSCTDKSFWRNAAETPFPNTKFEQFEPQYLNRHCSALESQSEKDANEFATCRLSELEAAYNLYNSKEIGHLKLIRDIETDKYIGADADRASKKQQYNMLVDLLNKMQPSKIQN